MTDEKEETTPEESPTKYRALKDGIWGKAGTIFSPVKPGGIIADVKIIHMEGFYGIAGTASPVIAIGLLMDSPDFEVVEELWEPAKVETDSWFILCANESSKLSIKKYGTPYHHSHGLFEHHSSEAMWQPFRAEQDATDCLVEIKELIQKRSKESRRLNADT